MCVCACILFRRLSKHKNPNDATTNLRARLAVRRRDFSSENKIRIVVTTPNVVSINGKLNRFVAQQFPGGYNRQFESDKREMIDIIPHVVNVYI